jgi:hypothetical protein
LSCWDAPTKEHPRFFRFFEASGGLAPYLAYEKSNWPPCNNTLRLLQATRAFNLRPFDEKPPLGVSGSVVQKSSPAKLFLQRRPKFSEVMVNGEK